MCFFYFIEIISSFFYLRDHEIFIELEGESDTHGPSSTILFRSDPVYFRFEQCASPNSPSGGDCVRAKPRGGDGGGGGVGVEVFFPSKVEREDP